MAEYYPLLAKAIGSLPNATPEMRQVVYERARKALIGQLRTLHPPVPDEDIEHESNELDRAVERLEGELASRPLAVAEAGPSTAEARVVSAPVAGPARSPVPNPPMPGPPSSNPAGSPVGAPGPAERRPPLPPLRTKVPTPRAAAAPARPAVGAMAPQPRAETPAASPTPVVPRASAEPPVSDLVFSDEPVAAGLGTGTVVAGGATAAEAYGTSDPSADAAKTATSRAEPPGAGATGFKLPGGRPRAVGRRPFAPQPASAAGAKRPLWIIPAGIGVVVLLVGVSAYKLRDRPHAVVHATAGEQQAQSDSGKIAERVGGPGPTGSPSTGPASTGPASNATAPAAPSTSPNSATANQPATEGQAAAPSNPDLPVAHRAALLVEAPDEASKVRTFLGTVVWKLNNVSGGSNDSVGLAVEADVDLPDDKMRAVVTFEKNTDASLPASHTIKVRFVIQPGSPTGDIKQISVPQLRREDSPTGEGLAGVTVSVIPNSFLVGLSPGAAEGNNLELMRSLQWIDIPMLLANGKIAKLTFEKSESGQRDLSEAVAAWQK